MAAHPEDITIGTHSGTFQADEALGIWLLRVLPKYKKALLKRSRDLAILEPLTIVIDVAGLYDHGKLRYDHHQRGFFETFDGDSEACCDGPDSATGVFKTKLSASGLVYKHYGREILCILYPQLCDDRQALDCVYVKMYKDFMEMIDGNDNGIEIGDNLRYKDLTSLPHRVHRLNSSWNAKGGPTEDERFEKASALCGEEFSDMLAYIVECELPAREIVETALKERDDIHPSGEVIRFSNGGCPWRTHLYDLERQLSLETLIKFVLYEDSAGMWRVQAVTVEGTDFTNRLGLLEQWRGVRDDELTSKAGIDGCKFVHASGFIGGNSTYEGALAMALKTIEASK